MGAGARSCCGAGAGAEIVTGALARFNPARLRSLVAVAAMVGFLAGGVAAVFATIAGEPVTEAAIALEEAQLADHPDTTANGGEEASVSRSDQRGPGLFAAYALTGAAFGALLAVTAHALRPGRQDVAHRLLVAGAVLAGGFTVAPWFKYPPNPPAVGDPATLSDRQSLYALMILVATIVGLAATKLSRRLRAATWPDAQRFGAVFVAIVVPMLVAFAVLPPAPDPVLVPATLVWRFRLASLGSGLTLWSLLTLGTAALATEAVRRAEYVSALDGQLAGSRT